MDEVEVRAATSDDWALWRDVRLRALRDAPAAFASTYDRETAFTEPDWRGRLDGKHGPAVLALADGRPVGLGGGYSDTTGWLLVVAMWVEPGWRGRAVGRRILDRIVGWAAERGLRCHLDVAVGNDPARRLYDAYGFVSTGRTEPLRAGSPDRTERMVLPAPPIRHFCDDTPRKVPKK